jgi:periplasmic copper chaperone A
MLKVNRRRTLVRAVAITGTAAAAVVLLAAPAFAHITVTPGSAVGGQSAVLTFHVPNEESNAQTVKVDIQIPTDHPIAQFLVKPVPGWSVTVKTVTLAKPLVTDDGSFSQAVSEVIWSGGQIAPGQFQDFSVSADPLPEGVSQLIFKAVQTYSNGDVVRWIDVPQPGQPAPDHPAPVLALTTGSAAAPAAAASSGAGVSVSGSAPASVSGTSTLAVAAGVGGLVFGLGGLGLAWLAWRRRPSPFTDAYPLDGEPAAPVPSARVASDSARAPQPVARAAQPAPRAPGTSGAKRPGGRRGSARH